MAAERADCLKSKANSTDKRDRRYQAVRTMEGSQDNVRRSGQRKGIWRYQAVRTEKRDLAISGGQDNERRSEQTKVRSREKPEDI